MPKGLGRKVPTDWKHVEKYPLTAERIPVQPVPVTIGINWYSNFDTPVKIGNRYWIGTTKNLGYIRGGHCVCMPHLISADNYSWYLYYDQGNYGACTGFGSSRMMSLLNRKEYNAFWLWDRAKELDEFADTNPGDNNGSTIRAAMDALRTLGHEPKRSSAPILAEGISTNRWATQVEQVHQALANPAYDALGALPFLNNWGKEYPHVVYIPDETVQRLMNEDGEFTIITDR